jgi:CheY-like chemotaxis protein
MSKKILIVDDDRDLVMSLEQALKMNDYQVAVAYSGSEGLQQLVDEEPDLIILDVMMETDTAGFEVADQIRRNRSSRRYDRYRDIPIIMLTAINQVTNSRFSMSQDESFLPQVEAFVTKPVEIDELFAKVRELLD